MPRNKLNPHEKHTACRARVQLKVKSKMPLSKDKYLMSYPCEVNLYFVHNHLVNTAAALKHRQPSKEVESIFIQLFSEDYSPTSALQYYKSKLEEEYPDDYLRLAADGAIVPKRKWCYNLYYKHFKREYCDEDIVKENNGEEIITLTQEQFSPKQDSVEKLQTIFSTLQEKYINDPATYGEPIENFIDLFGKIKKDSHLVSALQTFGKYKYKKLQGGKSGHRAISSSRPLKSKKKEHGYTIKVLGPFETLTSC